MHHQYTIDDKIV